MSLTPGRPPGHNGVMSADPPTLPWNHLPGREHLPGVKKVSYTHDAMIDVIIQNPMISQGELAAYFGYTQPWVSLVMSSDAFRARLEMRKEELVDPTIRLSIEERFKALAQKSLEVLQKKLENPNVSDQLALQAASLAAKSLGLGQPKVVQIQSPGDGADRLERLGGRLLALMGEGVVKAKRSLDYEIVDAEAKTPAGGWAGAEGNGFVPGGPAEGTGAIEAPGERSRAAA